MLAKRKWMREGGQYGNRQSSIDNFFSARVDRKGHRHRKAADTERQMAWGRGKSLVGCTSKFWRQQHREVADVERWLTYKKMAGERRGQRDGYEYGRG